MRTFAELVQKDPSMVTMVVDCGKPDLFANLLYWMERETMAYPRGMN